MSASGQGAATAPSAPQAGVAVAFVAAAIALIFWSGTAIANKFAVAHMDALTAGVLRSAIAGTLALMIAAVMRLPFPAAARDRGLLLLSGATSFAIWPMLLSLGIARTTASHAALIMAMIPVLTVLIAALLDRRMPRPMWWLGAMLALAATAVLILSRDAAAGSAALSGDLLVLGGCVSCATGYVAGGKLAPKIGTVATTFWSLALAMLVLLPVLVWISARTQWTQIPSTAWMGIAWMALCSSLAGYALWFFALGRAGIARISSLQLMMPVLTLVFAGWLLGETFNGFLALVCLTVVAGTLIAQSQAR